MTRTIFFLIATVVAAPFLCYYFATPLTEDQQDLLWQSGYIVAGVIAYSFIVSELSKNYSQTDKLWSIIPIIYVWFVTIQTGFSPRLILMSVLVTVWGARLTFNFARRGGYSWKFWDGDEDYRWAILKSRPPFAGNKIGWSLFNLFFISAYQHVLIFLFSMPIIAAAKEPSALSLWDGLLATLFIGFIVYETIADQQQWNYQSEKYKLIQQKKPLTPPYDKGFTHTGLWSISRHPNYFAEQSVWIIFYLFSVSATGEWLNWSVMGCLLLLILFYSSSNFSEEISAAKYPEYKEYQKKVPRFIPGTK